MVTLNDVLLNKVKFNDRILLIPNSECFTMKGWADRFGYVSFQFRSNGKKNNILGHRASYMINTNEEISTQDVIMHLCDNPSCINPKHLKKGTHNDNVQDRVLKNRSAIGESNGRYKHGKYVKKSVVKH